MDGSNRPRWWCFSTPAPVSSTHTSGSRRRVGFAHRFDRELTAERWAKPTLLCAKRIRADSVAGDAALQESEIGEIDRAITVQVRSAASPATESARIRFAQSRVG